VTLNGLEIGRVTQIVINESTGKLLVELQIKSNFPISKSSVAAIYEPGFIAGKLSLILKINLLRCRGTLRGEIRLGLTDKGSREISSSSRKIR
jgi:phospholipid/cholesterol/gamma-HCH transport system substrate-binding protein